MTTDLHQMTVLLAQCAVQALSDDAYSRAVTRNPELFHELRAAGKLLVLPAYSEPEIGTLKRSLFGVLPFSLIDQLGVARDLVQYAITHAAPFCARCSALATPPAVLGKFNSPQALPDAGFLILSAVDEHSDVPIRERCEWLGSERALIDRKLVRVEDLVSDLGEPVIGVISLTPNEAGAKSNAARLIEEAQAWFLRGGGVLRLVHFVSREAAGSELGTLSGNWSCPKCTRDIPALTEALIEEAQSCLRCKGQGWLRDETKRLVACRDCNGFGANTELSQYQLHGVALRDVAALSFREFYERPEQLPPELSAIFRTIIAGGFGEYPLGSASGLLSLSERARLTVLAGEISGFDGVQYLLDGAVTRVNPATASCDAKFSLLKPEVLREKTEISAKSELELVLREIRQGCLAISQVAFPISGISVVGGADGGGKSLLLSIIAARFAKRRKLAHLGSFGDLSRCSLIGSEVNPNQTVLEILGLAEEVAGEIARTRRAQELGIIASDLTLPSSRYACCSCAGKGGSPEGGFIERCQECSDVLYDWRIAGLKVAGRTVQELLTSTFSDLTGLVWMGEFLEYLVQAAPEGLKGVLTLGAPLNRFNRAEQRFIAVWGGLARILARGVRIPKRSGVKSLAGELVLVDGPKVMQSKQAQVLNKLLIDLNQMGATVIYADLPEGLEFGGSYVLQITPQVVHYNERLNEPYLDTRYARVCSAGE